MKKIRKKLRSSAGMTLTELLVALAIVALIGMSLTVGVNSAAKVYRDATRLYEAETLCGTILTYLEDEFRFGRNIHNENVAGSTHKEVVFDSTAFGNDVKVIVDGGKIKVGKEPASSYYDLLSTTAYTSGLMVIVKDDKSKISYDESSGLITITIAVGPNEDTVYASHTVTVIPVGS